MNPSDAERRSALSRAAKAGLKVLSFFVILEPIWMLLPFAGFLYGSGLQIESLGRRPSTAWLTHFVFPVGTLGWTGPILVAAGFVLFCIGAFQIYSAKIRKSGMVTTGVYGFVRHPQYIALTLFGLGLLLAWGRAIMFVAFFLMMFLYYHLAGSEERSCVRLFGENYERYRERTSFLFPGDRRLRPLGAWLARFDLPASVRVAGAFVATMAVCFGLIWMINAVKASVGKVPFMSATVELGGAGEATANPDMGAEAGLSAGVEFVSASRVAVVRGPSPNGAASGFAERVLGRIRKSEALAKHLAYLDEPDGDSAIVFCAPHEPREQIGTPGERATAAGQDGRRGPPLDASGPDRVRLTIFRCSLAPGADFGDTFSDRAELGFRGACFAPVDLGRAEGEDIVDGEVFEPGIGFLAEERWDFLMGQTVARRTASSQPRIAAVSGEHANAQLVLVQAPIMRTRLDPAFAREILDRLAGSQSFRDRLRKSGAGGDVVAVTFPRPGPNWYSEHRGTPQVSAFVILTRMRDPGASLDTLFRSGDRDLLGAFIADMDLGIAATEDSVHDVTMVGPARDLEERWRFFLSGVAGAARVNSR